MVDSLAGTKNLPDTVMTDSGLKITPLDASVPQAAQRLIDQVAASRPHLKITDLLLEVDTWTGFTAHFTHLKNGDAAKDRISLLTAILAECDQRGADQDGRVTPGSELCKALVAAGLAHPR